MLIYLNLIDTEEEKNKFEQIYNNYRHTMYYVAKGILKDNYLSEDAVHNAFINIAKNMDNISEVKSNSTKAYVVVIVRNISLNILKKQNKIVNIETYCDELSTDSYSLEDEVLSELSFNSIVDKITELPVIYKDILYLTYVENLKTKEIADIISISNETVKKRLQRGRKKLFEKLNEDN